MDVEVDTDPDEVPASTPPARLRAEEELRGARAPRKRKWDGEAELSQRELLGVPVKRRANNEPARPKQKARKLILLADSSVDTGRAAVVRNSPASEENTPSALKSRKQIAVGEGRDAETRVPLAVPVREGVVGQPGVGSPTPLEVLAGHGVEAAEEEAARPSARESSRISAATEILKTEDDTPSEDKEVQSVQGTPTGLLYEQVMTLLWYLDRKATKYRDHRQFGSYVEEVRNWTRIKVATNHELMVLDQKYR
ncbi:hypothetical protein AXG93_2028s1000 [Marchantia polymorpha subsp. ruderalis]|uniref:Uncharacterized protein n=1 Tax=Marchantia polymorpha subsp. ruderalis TaxID=1480154 RepID=A0A176VUK0_MARPO|nr:hypothetical protein AXG93_2028s1000 [Marchantia polymorpha subsp. ruderalis]